MAGAGVFVARAVRAGLAASGAVALTSCGMTLAAPAASIPVPTLTASPSAAATSPPGRAASRALVQRGFESSIRRLDARQRARMTGVSWRPGCPVPLSHLRLLTVSYRSFAGDRRTGQLVVHRDVAAHVVGAMRSLYRQRFPIRRMRLVEAYGGSDPRSVRADNTSAFNCRPVPGSTTWSEHAYGRAIDINPVENPYWRPGAFLEPARGRPYLDRSRRTRGMFHEGDAVRAFDRIGWGWGGRWNTLKDWQHFSVSGR